MTCASPPAGERISHIEDQEELVINVIESDRRQQSESLLAIPQDTTEIAAPCACAVKG